MCKSTFSEGSLNIPSCMEKQMKQQTRHYNLVLPQLNTGVWNAYIHVCLNRILATQRTQYKMYFGWKIELWYMVHLVNSKCSYCVIDERLLKLFHLCSHACLKFCKYRQLPAFFIAQCYERWAMTTHPYGGTTWWRRLNDLKWYLYGPSPSRDFRSHIWKHLDIKYILIIKFNYIYIIYFNIYQFGAIQLKNFNAISYPRKHA